MTKDSANRSRTTPESSKLKHRVFIVDDHPILCKGLSHLIDREADLQVCGSSSDSLEALRKIGDCRPDIAIIDIALREMSGLRLVEELAARQADLPTLVFSVHDENLYAERCLRAGAKGYVMKTEPPETVITALKKILMGEIFVSEKLGTILLNKFIKKQGGDYRSPIEQLSNRELEVFEYIGRGLKTKEIAQRLNLSVKTIETYVDHIKKKMNFRDSRDLFIYAIQYTMGVHSE